eukprot:scaffold57767_cov16-Tisochrysis_lutea.AAC.1
MQWAFVSDLSSYDPAPHATKGAFHQYILAASVHFPHGNLVNAGAVGAPGQKEEASLLSEPGSAPQTSADGAPGQQDLAPHALGIWEKLLPLQRKLHGVASEGALLEEVASWGAAQVSSVTHADHHTNACAHPSVAHVMYVVHVVRTVRMECVAHVVIRSPDTRAGTCAHVCLCDCVAHGCLKTLLLRMYHIVERSPFLRPSVAGFMADSCFAGA